MRDCVGHHGLIMRLRTHNTIVPVLIDSETGNLARDPKTGFAIRQPYSVGGEIIVKIPSEQAFVGYFKNTQATKNHLLQFCCGSRSARFGKSACRSRTLS